MPEREFRLQMRLMWTSLGVAAVLLIAKVIAAAITDSAAIYSDAAESVVHVLAVAFACYSLRLARKPADAEHHFGHDKISYLSAGFEGAMISAAALLIFYEAFRSFFHGAEITQLGIGAALTGMAAAVNVVLGLALIRIGRKQRSLILESNGKHVLTDVWTSAGVLVALLLIHLTGWTWWDPLVAILLALNILVTGWNLMRRSLSGLMDEADPAAQQRLVTVLDQAAVEENIGYHQLRHRHSGRTHWAEVHLVFPDATSVADAHRAATRIESKMAAALEHDSRIISHLEPRSEEARNEPWERSHEDPPR